GTFGAISSAAEELQREGYSVAHLHLKHLNPFPRNLGEVLSRFETVIAAELNFGQLAFLLRGKYLFDVKSLSKVQGQPFTIAEIVQGVKRFLKTEEVRSWQKKSLA
ncbi:MAG: hypothetical protein HYW02_06715, partial [Deltaproteobacteria bacterium]|nr:hypothetical protein [Deltaproteobacteria bacterium]